MPTLEEKKSKTSDLNIILKKLGEELQIKPKVSRRKGIIKSRN